MFAGVHTMSGIDYSTSVGFGAGNIAGMPTRIWPVAGLPEGVATGQTVDLLIKQLDCEIARLRAVQVLSQSAAPANVPGSPGLSLAEPGDVCSPCSPTDITSAIGGGGIQQRDCAERVDSPSNAASRHLGTPSKGSAGHPHSCASPCRYVKRKSGCRDGADCPNCHFCFWRRREAKPSNTPPNTEVTAPVAASVPSTPTRKTVQAPPGSPARSNHSDASRMSDVSTIATDSTPSGASPSVSTLRSGTSSPTVATQADADVSPLGYVPGAILRSMARI